MKKLFVGAILLSVIFSASAGSEKGYQEDGLLTAIYAVNNPIERIEVYLNYTVVVCGDKQEDHSAFLNYVEEEGITLLTINNWVIVDTSEGDEPLEVFPHPIVGEIKNLTGYAQVISDSDQVVASGATFRPLLRKREVISFELEWWPVEQIIHYDLLPDSQVEIRLKTDSSSPFSKSVYDPSISGFRVFISPSISNLKYEIWNQTEILETGTVVFNSNPNQLIGSGSAFNFNMSGITRGNLDPEIIYRNIPIDGYIFEADEAAEAKVFILDKDYGNLVGTIEFLSQVPLDSFEVLCYTKKNSGGVELLEVSVLEFRIEEETSRFSFFVQGAKNKTLILVIKNRPRTPQTDKLRFNAYLYNEFFFGEKG